MRSALKVLRAVFLFGFAVPLFASGASAHEQSSRTPEIRHVEDELGDFRNRMSALHERLISEPNSTGITAQVELDMRLAAERKDANLSSQAKPLATCPTQGLSLPATISGFLGASSCIDPVIGSREDIYTFTATAGQTVTVTMSSSAFDVFLYMSGTSASITSFRSSSGVSTEKIVYVLPSTGSYKIEAETLYPPTSTQPTTGAYTLSASLGGTSTPPPDYPNHSCGIYPITCGGSQSARMTFGSCVLSGGSFADFYSFSGTAGDIVTVSLVVASSTFTRPFIAILPPQGDSTNPPSATGTTSATISSFRLTSTGSWGIGVSTLDVLALGNYTVSLTCAKSTCAAPTIQVNPQSTTVAPNGSVLLSVSAQGTSLHYAWHDDSNPLVTVGVDSPQFQTQALSRTTKFYVAISNACGAVNSATATVTVLPPKRRAVHR
jgi:hypothetical protein